MIEDHASDHFICTCLALHRPSADKAVRAARRLNRPYADFAATLLLRGFTPVYNRANSTWRWDNLLNRPGDRGLPWGEMWVRLRHAGEFFSPERAYLEAAKVWAGMTPLDKWLVYRVVR